MKQRIKRASAGIPADARFVQKPKGKRRNFVKTTENEEK